MKILVTGSSGTIETRLCEQLLADGHKVVGADRRPNAWQPTVDAITQKVNLLDPKQCATLPTDVECIVHLAANARVYDLVENPDGARENIITTYNVLEFARRNEIKKFIFASSRETYGNLDEEKFTEDMVRVEHCESPYTASKIAGEAFVESYRRCYGIDTVILRFSNVYGMYDESERIVPLFLRRARAGEPLIIFGKEKCLDFTYIDDAVNGIRLVVEHFNKVKGDVFNLAYGEGTTLVHLAERIKELLTSDSPLEIGESRTGEITRYVADISHAKKILGFNPTVPFDEGIERAVAWYGEHA